jgi:hypothetical protein
MKQEIKPIYTTFEQAKWLKEKGFDIPCREGWYIAQLDPYKGQLFPDDTGGKHEIEKPEQHQVVEWLRINHGIWISVQQDVNKYDAYIKNKKYDRTKVQHVTNQFNLPQEAYSGAFDYIKDNNLI